MPRYLTDEDWPTIECCGVEHQWSADLDRQNSCPYCGDVFDWIEALDYWDMSDIRVGEDEEDEEDEEYRMYGSRAVDDDDEQDLFDRFTRVFGEETYDRPPYRPPSNYTRSMGAGEPAKPPTIAKVPRNDPFLDRDIPDTIFDGIF